MRKSNKTTIPSSDGFGGELEFAERVTHLARGYDNSQSVVRFLDAKASAVVGAVPIVLAVLTGFFGLVKDWGKWDEALSSHDTCAFFVLAAVTGLAALVTLVFAAVAIDAAFEAISPRGIGEAKPSVLFPFEPAIEIGRPDKCFASRVRLLTGAGKREDVLEDYERQIIRMSQIVAQKVSSVTKAVKRLKYFLISAVVLLGLFLTTTFLSNIIAPHLRAARAPTTISNTISKSSSEVPRNAGEADR